MWHVCIVLASYETPGSLYGQTISTASSPANITGSSLSMKRAILFINTMHSGQVLLEVPRHVAHLLKVSLIQCRAVVFGLVLLLRETVLGEGNGCLKR